MYVYIFRFEDYLKKSIVLPYKVNTIFVPFNHASLLNNKSEKIVPQWGIEPWSLAFWPSIIPPDDCYHIHVTLHH